MGLTTYYIVRVPLYRRGKHSPLSTLWCNPTATAAGRSRRPSTTISRRNFLEREHTLRNVTLTKGIEHRPKDLGKRLLPSYEHTGAPGLVMVEKISLSNKKICLDRGNSNDAPMTRPRKYATGLVAHGKYTRAQFLSSI